MNPDISINGLFSPLNPEEFAADTRVLKEVPNVLGGTFLHVAEDTQVYPVTPEFRKSAGIVYSGMHVSRLIRAGQVEGVVYSKQMLLTPAGLDQLLALQQTAVESVGRRGRPPGSKSRTNKHSE
jgi:hypothetical protein